jgi:hypothetical protein
LLCEASSSVLFIKFRDSLKRKRIGHFQIYLLPKSNMGRIVGSDQQEISPYAPVLNFELAAIFCLLLVIVKKLYLHIVGKY